MGLPKEDFFTGRMPLIACYDREFPFTHVDHHPKFGCKFNVYYPQNLRSMVTAQFGSGGVGPKTYASS